MEPIPMTGIAPADRDSSGPLTCEWQQVAGPPVVIIDANTATPTIGGSMQPGTGRFPTPKPGGFTQTDEVQECEFELVVSDGELISRPDTVKVIIVLDFGASTLQQENPPFNPNKPTVIYFGGGRSSCENGIGGGSWGSPAWAEKANIISFPSYMPDSDARLRIYYPHGDMIIVYLSSVAPDYKQPIQTIGFSMGGDPAMDVGIHLNRVYRDARYAVNRMTNLDGGCRANIQGWDFYIDICELFLTSAVDGEQCWIDYYDGGGDGRPLHKHLPFHDRLVVALGLSHGRAPHWYRNSLTGNDMNNFNNGVVAGAYWSIIGPGKNLQLAPQTDVYYFRWDGNEQSGVMSSHAEAQHPGRLPEPVTLVGPPDGAVVDANGSVLSCQESQNAVGYQLLFGGDPYHMVYLFSDTPTPPEEVITTFPFNKTWWTVKARDQYGSTIYADPVCINAENVIPQTIENATIGREYASIQVAINDASNGDEIIVSPGIYQYQEKIDFKGKSLTLRSTDPNDPDVVAETNINGGHQGSVVTFSGGEEPSCVLAGFTITGGIVGISCHDASPTIRNCTIESNGPIAIEFWYGYEPIIIDCTIIGKVIDRALLAHWALDETEGDIASDSVGDRDGTLYGNPVWQPAAGQVNGALELDGIDDYVSTPFVSNPADGEFSVFAWIKGGAPGQVVISQTGGVDWLLADLSEGKLITGLSKPAGSRFPPQPLVSEFIITDGQWHRLGLVWDGSQRMLYVDDVEVARDTQAGLEDSVGGLYIGAGKALEPGSFFSGLIDDVRIYDKAITP